MGAESVFERVDRLISRAAKHFRDGDNAANLPEDLAKIFERWTMAYSISKQYNHMGSEYILSLYSIWLKNVHGLDNVRTAREDLYAAPMVGYMIDPINREFQRSIAIERLNKAIGKAMVAGKYAEQARLEGVLFKYLDPANDPPQITDADSIQKNFNIMPAFDPQLLNVENTSFEVIYAKKEVMSQRKKKLLDKLEDANFVEVKEEMEDESTI